MVTLIFLDIMVKLWGPSTLKTLPAQWTFTFCFIYVKLKFTLTPSNLSS